MSSLADNPSEHEIPVAMLALVGVAIHAALTEWRQGSRKAVQFTADAFNDPYTEHTTLLKGIKAKRKGVPYHALMHRLYRSASNITPISAAATSTGTALDFVDIDGMAID
ncbi:hypothetical protein LXA43DRAFT_894353 [Ganoderma leucocontextum]|nr:hypothetical protein LXA43DRAFT_894353 [Ganoderma leucocontextum]